MVAQVRAWEVRRTCVQVFLLCVIAQSRQRIVTAGCSTGLVESCTILHAEQTATKALRTWVVHQLTNTLHDHTVAVPIID